MSSNTKDTGYRCVTNTTTQHFALLFSVVLLVRFTDIASTWKGQYYNLVITS